jgi:aminoglycoside 3-N-acetyltransferase
MGNRIPVTREMIADDLRILGISKGEILNLKISLKSIGMVEGGADTVIDALLDVVGEEGTLVADSFVEPFPVFFRIFRKKMISDDSSLSYAGAVTNAIMKKSGVLRATHPIQRFAAVGKHAKELTENFTENSEPYGFLKQMAFMDAKNIRIGGKDKVVGVGTTHIAICDLKLKQKKIAKGIYYKDSSGKVKFFKAGWANGCPVGFNNLLDVFRDNGKILSEGKVGEAECIVTSMKDTLAFEKRPCSFFMQ